MTKSISGLRIRLILLVLLAVLPALGLILYTGLEQRRLAAADAQEEALRLARLAVADEDRLIDGGHQLLVALAQLPVVRAGDRAGCQALFADLLAEYPFYTGFSAATPSGDVFCSAPLLTGPVSFADRAWYQQLIQTRDFVVSGYQIGRISGKAVVVLAYPVLDATGGLQAIVSVGLDLAWINQLAAEAQLPARSVFTVIDHNGTILARHPNPEAWVGQSMPEAPLVEAVLAQGAGMAEAPGLDGVVRLYAFTPLSGVPDADTGVYVSVGIPSDVVFADANRALARNLTLLGLVTVFTLVAARLFGDLLVLRPVNALVAATQRLAAGDLDARTGIPYRRGELGQLAQAFDQMAGALEQREAERQQAEEALEAYSARLEELVAERTQELREAQENLIRQEKLAMLGQLAGGVGHELRNPLGAIRNAAYFLNMVLSQGSSGEEPDPEIQEMLHILDKEVGTSERIINSLLDFARAKPFTLRQVDVNAVVQEALSRVNVPEDTEVLSQLDEARPTMLGDPDQLGQVFGNIILNAIQAMPEGGRLTVSVSTGQEQVRSRGAKERGSGGAEEQESKGARERSVVVSISDSGVGIPQENLGKVFEPLFTTKAKGIGLGLALTKTLVEGHGGTIEVASEVGAGSTFTVRLPGGGERET
jgi:signal transduction histidine kinase